MMTLKTYQQKSFICVCKLQTALIIVKFCVGSLTACWQWRDFGKSDTQPSKANVSCVEYQLETDTEVHLCKI